MSILNWIGKEKIVHYNKEIKLEYIFWCIINSIQINSI